MVIPVGEESSVLLNISPAEYITEVEVQISDNSVAAIKSLTPTDSALIVEFESAGIGTTTCVAVCGDVIATCTVRVDPISVQSISLNKSSLLLPVYGNIMYIKENFYNFLVHNYINIKYKGEFSL